MKKTKTQVLKSDKETKSISDKWVLPAIITVVFLIYLYNISPSVYGGDAGDFITASKTLGVAHPSGYPLYTMMGVIALKVLSFLTPASAVATISSLFAAISLIPLFHIVRILTKEKIIAYISCIVLAFTYTFWLFAETVEVFSLHSFLLLNMILLSLLYYENAKDKYLYILAFLAGLSLTNNQTILLIFPPIAIFLLLKNPRLVLNYGLILKAMGLFVLGLTPYFYIYFAALKFPYVNWGFAVNYDNFTNLILRKDYGWVTRESYDISIMKNSLRAYSDYFINYINLLIPPLALMGTFFLIKARKYALTIFLVLLFVFTGPFFIIYSNTPLENLLRMASFEKFYLSSVIITVFTSSLGIVFLRENLKKLVNNQSLQTLVQNSITVLFLLIGIGSFITNFQKTNFRDVYIGDNFAKDILSSLPENSAIYIVGDTQAFNSIYMQQVYNYRTDVYIPGMHEGYSGILKKSGKSSEEITKYQIEKRGGIDKELVFSMYSEFIKSGNVFGEQPLELVDFKDGKIVSVPWGLFYKFEFENSYKMTKEEYLRQIMPILESYHIGDLEKYGVLTSNNPVYADIKKLYSLAYERTAKYLLEKYDDKDTAKLLLQKSIELDPLIY